MSERPDDPVEVLRRWEETGAMWHVVGYAGGTVTVGLFTCDGGEEVSRFTTSDPDVLEMVATREP